MAGNGERCHYCDKTDDLRPYGPGGAMVCFGCAMATPEREAETGRNFEVQLEASEAMSPHGITVIDGKSGPNPYNAECVSNPKEES